MIERTFHQMFAFNVKQKKESVLFHISTTESLRGTITRLVRFLSWTHLWPEWPPWGIHAIATALHAAETAALDGSNHLKLSGQSYTRFCSSHPHLLFLQHKQAYTCLYPCILCIIMYTLNKKIWSGMIIQVGKREKYGKVCFHVGFQIISVQTLGPVLSSGLLRLLFFRLLLQQMQ